MRVLTFIALMVIATSSQAFEIGRASVEKGIRSHVKEIPQCAVIKLPKARFMNDGDTAYYDVSGLTRFDVMMDLRKKKVHRVTVVSMESRSDELTSDMMCMTYALMRTIQPDLTTTESALSEAKDLWIRSAKKPFKKAFYFDSFTAQWVPMQVVAE